MKPGTMLWLNCRIYGNDWRNDSPDVRRVQRKPLSPNCSAICWTFTGGRPNPAGGGCLTGWEKLRRKDPMTWAPSKA